MSEIVQENPENSISEQLESILSLLSTDQIRFVIARLETTTDKEAAESVNLKPDTVYHWKSRDEAPIEEALQLMIADGLIVAHHVRRRNLAKAMMVKVAGLDSEDERLRQNVSTEIIEWEMGRATQGVELGGKGGGALLIRVIYGDDGTDDNSPETA